jgi:hypothetical protein
VITSNAHLKNKQEGKQNKANQGSHHPHKRKLESRGSEDDNGRLVATNSEGRGASRCTRPLHDSDAVTASPSQTVVNQTVALVRSCPLGSTSSGPCTPHAARPHSLAALRLLGCPGRSGGPQTRKSQKRAQPQKKRAADGRDNALALAPLYPLFINNTPALPHPKRRTAPSWATRKRRAAAAGSFRSPA